MSVGAYAPLAHAAIDELVERQTSAPSSAAAPACISGLRSRSSTSLQPRRRGRGRGGRRPTTPTPIAAHAALRGLDPIAAEVVHRNDRRRVVRALELAEAGSSLAASADRLWGSATRLPTLVVGLEVPADELERRIVARTTAMFEAGVVDEVRAALERGSVAHGGDRRSGSARSQSCRRPRPASGSSSGHAAMRRTSANGCAGFRVSSPSTGQCRLTRSPRRFSSSRTATRARQRRPWRLLR